MYGRISLLVCMQAGAAAVASSGTGSGGAVPTVPSGPTPMDSDDAILKLAFGDSGRVDSESRLQSSAASSSGAKSSSDSLMEEAFTVAQNGVLAGGPRGGVAGMTGPSGANDPGAMGSNGQDQEEEAVAQLGFAVQFVVQGLRNGAGPTLMPLLVRLLPFLLKTQVITAYAETQIAMAM